jgi:hypothetical protein
MPFIVEGAEAHAGKVVGNGHCVRFLQVAGGVPHTSRWRKGAAARGATLERGTAIATFDPDGTYGNHVDGRSHAAVVDRVQTNGIMVWDQWVGHPVARRLLKYRNGEGPAVNDGDRFYVIEPA